MTDSGPQASPEWISTARLCAEHEYPTSIGVRIINGAAKVGPTGPARQLDPIHILGCSREETVELFHGRPVTPGEAEAIAQRSYRWRRHLHDPKSYWITTAEAARILELTPRQVKSLLDRGQLQHVRHASRVRLMRRANIVALGVLNDRGNQAHGRNGGRLPVVMPTPYLRSAPTAISTRVQTMLFLLRRGIAMSPVRTLLWTHSRGVASASIASRATEDAMPGGSGWDNTSFEVVPGVLRASTEG